MKIILALCLATLATTACGRLDKKDQNTGKDPVTVTREPAPQEPRKSEHETPKTEAKIETPKTDVKDALLGDWESTCIAADGGGSKALHYTFTEAKDISVDIFSFSDAACTAPVRSVTYTGDYAFDGKDLDFSIRKAVAMKRNNEEQTYHCKGKDIPLTAVTECDQSISGISGLTAGDGELIIDDLYFFTLNTPTAKRYKLTRAK